MTKVSQYWTWVVLGLLLGCAATPQKSPPAPSASLESNANLDELKEQVSELAALIREAPTASDLDSQTHSELLKEVQRLRARIQHLVKDHKAISQTHDEHQHSEHPAEGSIADIEALKWLQKLYEKVLALERALAEPKEGAVNTELIKTQVIDIARQRLAEESDIGKAYVTSRQLIEAKPSNQENQWDVSIRFKKDRKDSQVYVANLICTSTSSKISCELLRVEAQT